MHANPLDTAKEAFQTALSKGFLLSFHQIPLSCEEEELSIYHPLLQKWYQSITQLSFITYPLSNYEELIIHAPTKIIYKTALNREKHECDLTPKDIHLLAEVLTLKYQQEWNYKTPFVSFYANILNVDVRVSLVHFSTTIEGCSKVFIRILNKHIIAIENYKAPAHFFTNIIRSKKNVIIAGATGSGKTTFTNSLMHQIPKDEHIVTIEDTQELIAPTPFTTRFLTDQSSKTKSMNAYLKYAMRITPDRIILGEIRAEEAESSLLAMNSGHKGFLTTIHANSAKDAIDRLCLLFKVYSQKDLSFELVLGLVSKNIDYVIFLENKQITEIIEIYGSQKDQLFHESLFKHDISGHC